MPRQPLRLDARRPVIVVPLTASGPAELDAQVAALAEHPVDVVEWRVDLHRGVADAGERRPAEAGAELVRLAGLLRSVLPSAALLATFRTTAEGGAGAICDEEYAALVGVLAETGLADAVDVEYRRGSAARAVAAAHAAATPVVASFHDFDATPPAGEIVAHLAAMEELGADVAKLAAMPRSRADVLTLLEATERRYREAAVPLVTVSMGPLGAPSRLCGPAFGSAAGFATVGEASAPGQLPVAHVRAAFDALLAAQAPGDAG